MSRLFDRLLVSIQETQRPAPMLDNLIVVDGTPVSDYFYTGTPQEHWNLLSDFPNIALPWDACFVEFRAPRYIQSEEHGEVQWPATAAQSWGFQCFAISKSDPDYSTVINEFASTLSPTEQFAGSVPSPTPESWRTALQKAAWFVQVLTYHEHHKGAVLGPTWSLTFPVTDNGRLLPNPLDPSTPLIYQQVLEFHPLWQAMKEDAELFSLEQSRITTLFDTLLLVFCFCHCKNVGQDLVNPPPKLSKRHSERHGVPLHQYYTLKIEPMTRILQTEGRAETQGLRRALHICRGHFKDYTQHGLFGRSKGLYWWPMHVRGTSAQGKVMKDYRVYPPSSPKIK